MDVRVFVFVVYRVDCGLCDWLIARIRMSYRVICVCGMV
jgi:hypothetical protein